MIYFLYGDNQFQKQKYLKEILIEIDLNNIQNYADNSVSLEEIINYCNTNSLFGEKKGIIISDHSLLINCKDETKLIDYLNNPNPQTILIFNFNLTIFDQRKKIFKAIKNKGTIEQFNQKKDVFLIVKSFFLDYQISDNTIQLFISKTGNDLNIIENESQKLKSYCSTKTITDVEVELVTSVYNQPDIFCLLDAIINKDAKNAILAYQNIIKYNDDSTKIIALIANQLRLIYQTSQLYNLGYDFSEIANKLKIHPYRVKLANQKKFIYCEQKIFELLLNLINVDIGIKTGTIKSENALELFIYGNN